MIDILGERAYNISTRIGGDYMLDVNMIIANNIQAEDVIRRALEKYGA